MYCSSKCMQLLISIGLLNVPAAISYSEPPIPAEETIPDKTPTVETAIPEVLPEKTTENATPVSEKTAPTPQVEVVFVLDSTGSMSELIEGAKQKIWAIANSIITQKPTPEVKIGLISYRDKGDTYITQLTDLTSDIDAVYTQLKSFSAAGGGDGPESVNQALWEAVHKMSWSDKEKRVYRVIFLVGDFPPHMDYQDDVKYPQTCLDAMDKSLIINTIQCGENSETTAVWKEIAKKSEGTFVQIQQTGGMVVRTSPYDEDIAKLTRELSDTVIPYGSAHAQMEVIGKLRRAEEDSIESNAERAKFNNISGGKAVQGSGDLVQSFNDGHMDMDAVAAEDLPESMKKLSPAELEKVIKEKQNKRADLNAQITTLSQKRDTWLAEDAKKRVELAAKRKAELAAADSSKPAATSDRLLIKMSDAKLPESAAAAAPAYESSDLETDSFDDSVSEIIIEQMSKQNKK